MNSIGSSHQSGLAFNEPSGITAAPEASTEADVLLPSQYYALNGGARLTGEQRLMLAVLADAINILQQKAIAAPGVHKRRLVRETEAWLFEHDEREPFSFVNICEALSIEPATLRKRIVSLCENAGTQAQRPRAIRLRLKESVRSQHMTVNRVRSRRSQLRAGSKTY